MNRLTEKTHFGLYRIKPDVGEDAIIQKHNYYDSIDKLGQLEDIEDWLKTKKFYGKALNDNNILELKFEKLDLRKEDNMLLIHFKVLNSWATSIFYDIFSYGKTWALTEGELNNE